MSQSKQNTKDLSNREIVDSRIYSDKFFPNMLIIYKDARRKTKQ